MGHLMGTQVSDGRAQNLHGDAAGARYLAVAVQVRHVRGRSLVALHAEAQRGKRSWEGFRIGFGMGIGCVGRWLHALRCFQSSRQESFHPSRRWHSELGVRRAWRRSAAACVQDEHPCADSLTDSFDK